MKDNWIQVFLTPDQFQEIDNSVYELLKQFGIADPLKGLNYCVLIKKHSNLSREVLFSPGCFDQLCSIWPQFHSFNTKAIPKPNLTGILSKRQSFVYWFGNMHYFLKFTSSVRINYFPTSEVLTFGLIFVSLIVAFFTLNLSVWVIPLFILVSYFIILGNSKIIKLNNNNLKIMSFNPLYRSHSITTESIVKISSSENWQYDTTVSAEMYSHFQRTYTIEYLDENKQTKEVTFSIYNLKKEKALFEALRDSYGA